MFDITLYEIKISLIPITPFIIFLFESNNIPSVLKQYYLEYRYNAAALKIPLFMYKHATSGGIQMKYVN